MDRSTRVLGLAVLGAFFLGAAPSQADVFVRADVNKQKDIFIDEDVVIFKDIELFVNADIPVNAASEHDIVKNQKNQFQFVEDETAASIATIDAGVASGADGIILINQSPGFLNNQANEAGITSGREERAAEAAAGAGDDGGVFVHSQVSLQQINGASPILGNDAASKKNSEDDGKAASKGSNGDHFVNQYIAVLPATYTDTIDNAFVDGSGIVGINQSAGSINNQDNSVGIAIGENSVFALGEVDLGQFNTFNLVDVIDIARIDTITNGAFSGFSGVATVNQSSGAMNNQANVVNMAVNVTSTGLVPIPAAQ